MPRKKMPESTVPTPTDPMQAMLGGQPVRSPSSHTDDNMSERQGIRMARVTYRLPATVAERLRRRYHEQRLAGGTATMGDMVAEALLAWLDGERSG